MAKKSAPKGNLMMSDSFEEVFAPAPEDAAEQLDALLYFVHRRYSDSNGGIPNLGSFLVTRSQVVFSNEITSIEIQRVPEKKVMEILAPLVPVEEQEARIIFLQQEFSDLLLKFQKQGYLQVREMILRITDPEARGLLLEEFRAYKASLQKNS